MSKINKNKELFTQSTKLRGPTNFLEAPTKKNCRKRNCSFFTEFYYGDIFGTFRVVVVVVGCYKFILWRQLWKWRKSYLFSKGEKKMKLHLRHAAIYRTAHFPFFCVTRTKYFKAGRRTNVNFAWILIKMKDFCFLSSVLFCKND